MTESKTRLSPEACNARREYGRRYHAEWAKQNAEHVRAYQKEWRARNPEKVKEYARRSWEKKAAAQVWDDILEDLANIPDEEDLQEGEIEE